MSGTLTIPWLLTLSSTQRSSRSSISTLNPKSPTLKTKSGIEASSDLVASRHSTNLFRKFVQAILVTRDYPFILLRFEMIKSEISLGTRIASELVSNTAAIIETYD